MFCLEFLSGMLRRYQQEKAKRLNRDLDRVSEMLEHCKSYVRHIRDTHELTRSLDVRYELSYHGRDIARAVQKTVGVFQRINRRLLDVQCRLDSDELAVGEEGWGVAMDVDQKLKSGFDWVQWVHEQHNLDNEGGYVTEDTVLLSDGYVSDVGNF